MPTHTKIPWTDDEVQLLAQLIGQTSNHTEAATVWKEEFPESDRTINAVKLKAGLIAQDIRFSRRLLQ